MSFRRHGFSTITACVKSLPVWNLWWVLRTDLSLKAFPHSEFLTNVYLMMHLYVEQFPEWLPTAMAIIRFLIGMNLMMHKQVGFNTEWFLTEMAFVRLLPYAKWAMLLQFWYSNKWFSIILALVRLSPSVNSLMCVDDWFMAEVLLTVRTHIKSLTCVYSMMHL